MAGRGRVAGKRRVAAPLLGVGLGVGLPPGEALSKVHRTTLTGIRVREYLPKRKR